MRLSFYFYGEKIAHTIPYLLIIKNLGNSTVYKLMFIRLVTLLLFITSPLLSAANYGPLQAGDMLWNIATKIRPNKQVSRYQVMLAIQRINPHAFRVSCNLNSLKIGVMLAIPSVVEVNKISAREALQAFNLQNTQWKKRRSQPIQCSPVSAPSVVNELIAPIEAEEESLLNTAITEPLNEPQPKAVAGSTSPSLQALAIKENTYNTAPTYSSDSTPKISTSAPTAPPSPTKRATDTGYTAFSETPYQNYNYGNLDIEEEKSPSSAVIQWGEYQLPLSVLFTLLGIGAGLFLLIFLMVWMINRKQTAPNPAYHAPVSPPVQSQPIQTAPPPAATAPPVPDIPPPINQTEKILEQQRYQQSQQEEMMSAKLIQAREAIASGDSEYSQFLLKDILEHGSITQQQEARQLADISYKLRDLLKTGGGLAATTPADTPDSLHDIVGKTQLPTQDFLPENAQQVFDLIDKVFLLMDRELNAKGQLVEAYMQRHQKEFFRGDEQGKREQDEELVEPESHAYTVKPHEKVIEEEPLIYPSDRDTEQTGASQTRQPPKPTRYL